MSHPGASGRCATCGQGIPKNVGYYLHMFAGKLITTCKPCHEAKYTAEMRTS